MEWQGVRYRSWNSKRPVVFAHIILTETPGDCQAKEIWARISHRLDLWDAGWHDGLVGDMEDEGASIQGQVKREQDNKEGLARRFHNTVLYGKLHEAVRRLTTCRGGR